METRTKFASRLRQGIGILLIAGGFIALADQFKTMTAYNLNLGISVVTCLLIMGTGVWLARKR